MAKSASEISRLNAKSTFSKADSDITTSSSVLGKPEREFPYPAPLVEHGDARIISVVNQKGGVGKTTTTINLGAAFAELGRRVLLVDFDPQHSLSVGLNVSTRDIEGSVYNLLMDESTKIDDFLLKTSVPGMDMIPAHEDLSGAEGGLVNVIAREKILKRVLSSVTDFYDVILIDCQPSLGLLTVNALTASHWVLVPLECEYFALRGVALLDDIIKRYRSIPTLNSNCSEFCLRCLIAKPCIAVKCSSALAKHSQKKYLIPQSPTLFASLKQLLLVNQSHRMQVHLSELRHTVA